MRIFLKTGRQNHKMFVTPGEKSDCSDFFMPDGSKRMFTVNFKDGEAEVTSNLGRYMLDAGLAQNTRFVLLENVISAMAPEHRVTTMRHLGA